LSRPARGYSKEILGSAVQGEPSAAADQAKGGTCRINDQGEWNDEAGTCLRSPRTSKTGNAEDPVETPRPSDLPGDSEERAVDTSLWRWLGGPLFLGALLFVSIPIQLVKHNLLEFGRPFVFLGFCAAFLLAFLITCVLAFVLLKDEGRGSLAKGLFLAGVFVLLSDLLSPLAMGGLITGSEVPSEPLVGVLLEIVLAAVLTLAFLKLRSALVARLAWCVAVGLLLVEIAGLALLVRSFDGRAGMADAVAPGGPEFDGNIYQLTFDTFGPHGFDRALKESSLGEHLEGFTFYENARANYLATAMSVPSYSTGRLFKGKMPLEKWLDETAGQTILQRLGDAGFRTTFYSPYSHSWYFPADTVNDSPLSISHAADLCLLRAAPTILRQELFRDGKGLVSWIHDHFSVSPSGDIRSYQSYQRFLQMKESEGLRQDRGEYVYGHFMIPHMPYLMTRDGSYDPDESNHYEQSVLAVNMMSEFVQTLERLGRLESSLVIFHSDHGPGAVSSLEDRNRDRARPFLLIKPPQAKGGFRRSKDLVRLVDLPRVVYGVAGLNSATGESSGEIGAMPPRQNVSVHHVHSHRKSQDGRKYTIGRDLFAVDMNWYSLNAAGERTDHDPIPIRW
jgi:hypothetical protein